MEAIAYPDPTLEWEIEQPAIFPTDITESDLKTRLIAERLKCIGDKLQQQYSEEYLSNIITPFAFGSFQIGVRSIIISALNALRGSLPVSVQRQVRRVCNHAYHLIETLALEGAKLFEALSLDTFV